MELLTVPEVAEVLRVSEMSVYRLIASGQLAAVKVGVRRRVVSRDAIDTFVRAGGIDVDGAAEDPSERALRPTSAAPSTAS